MNAAEHLFCSSSLWRYLTQHQLLPWVLSGTRLGDHVLEIGAGYGAATSYLAERADRVTSLEYDHHAVARLKVNHHGDLNNALRGDAACLPFAEQAFSSVISILVLHHLKSAELQDRMFAEVLRVLRPGGVFLVFEVNDGWLHRIGHIKSTFTPLKPSSALARLTLAGFSRISVDFRRGGYRLSAMRAKRGEPSDGELPPSELLWDLDKDDFPREVVRAGSSES